MPINARAAIQDPGGVREGGRDRRHRKQYDPAEQEEPPAVDVGQPARREDQRPAGQHEGGDRPLQLVE